MLYVNIINVLIKYLLMGVLANNLGDPAPVPPPTLPLTLVKLKSLCELF